MKKVLFNFLALLLCSAMCLSVNAQTIVLQEDFSNVTDSVTSTDVSSSLDALLHTTGWTGNKIYKNSGKMKLGTSSVCGWIQTPALNLAADGGTFTISFDAEAWYHDSTSLSVYVNGTEYVVSGMDNDGSYGSYNHFSITAAGGTAATNVKFSGKSGAGKTRFFIDNIVISQNGGTPVVAMPTFSSTTGTYVNPLDVTISTATDSATIFYTLDGSTPDSNATIYTTPISISQTTTLKAIAFRPGFIPSSVATATYTFPMEVANIAAFKAINTVSSTPYKIAGDVTYVYGDGKYNYIQDESAALLVYSNSSSFPTIYAEGDQLSNLTGTFAQYQNQIEMVPTYMPAAAVSGIGSVTPVTTTISDILANYAQYDARLVTLQNVTLSAAIDYEQGTQGASVVVRQGSDSLLVLNRFKTLDTTISQNTVTDVTGFVAIYGTTIQIYPRSNADLRLGVQTVATPVFSPVAGTYADSVVVSISCATTGAEIRYTTDGTEPVETSALYQTPIVLTTNTTLKAKAFMVDWQASETVEATYTIAHEPAMAVAPSSLQFSSSNTTGTFDVTSAFLTEPIVLTCNDPHFTLSMDTIPAAISSASVTVTFDGTEPVAGLVTLVSGSLSEMVALSATATLPAPVITPETGASDTSIVVTITCANGNADVYYTTDGTTPTSASAVYSAPFELNVPGTYTVKAIAMLTNWTASALTEATYVVTAPVPPTPPTPTYNDTLAYATGFEATEGFTPGTTYNSAVEVLDGPANQQWGFSYGTVSNTSPISGASSLQMRWYASAATMLGSARTAFDVTHATRIRFQGQATNGLNAMVSYSIDGGNSYVDTVFEMTTYARTCDWVISENAEYDNVRFKISIVLPTQLPTSTSRLYIDSVCIYNFPSLISHVVDMPVIAPNSAVLYEPTDITISTATDGAQIYYTTDGTTPDVNSTLYTAPFTISSSTIVKAIAVKEGFTNSNMASATYTFPVDLPTIAAFKQANTATNSTAYKITGDVTVVFVNGSNIFIQDTTAGMLVYNQNGLWGAYQEGDVITGGIWGTYSLYHGMGELVPTRTPAESETNVGTIAPIITDIPTVLNNYEDFDARLITLQNVTFFEGGTFSTGSASNVQMEQNDEVMFCRSAFKNIDMTIPAGQVANVTGIMQRYDDDYQLTPRGNDDIEFVQQETVETPVIEVHPLTNAMHAVAITCATEGAAIYYTFDGTTPDEQCTLYDNSFIVPNGSTVKAIAMKSGMMNSEVAVYANVGIQAYAETQVSVYPNPTDGQLVVITNDLNVNTIDLYNVEGQLLQRKLAGQGSVTLNLSDYASGIYFVHVVGDNFTVVKKVLSK